MLYPKINSVFLRNPDDNYKTFLWGEWADPVFGYLADLEWEWTEKVDGMNIRIEATEEGITFGGRTDNTQIPASLMSVLDEIGTRATGLMNVILFGEGYGPKIQSGGDYRADQGFILYDVFSDNPPRHWYPHVKVQQVAHLLGIPVVPIVGKGKLSAAIEQTQRGFLSEVAEGRRQAEGLVMRPSVELHNHYGERVITKIKTKDFT